MQNIKETVLSGVLLVLLLGCNPSSQPIQLSDLEGRWYEPTLKVYEEWRLTGNNHLSGKAFEVNGKDTSVFEIMEIKEINGTITYLADVEKVMGQGIIDFPLASRSENDLVFINRAHDYPQVLYYQRKAPDTLTVTVGKYPLLEDKEPIVYHYEKVS